MAENLDPRTTPDDRLEDEHQPAGRDEELAEDEDLEETLRELYRDVAKGFEDQWERSNQIMEYWDIFHCQLTGHQFYTGKSKIFLPIVRDAIEARVTRFTNQIFPKNDRYVEATTEDGKVPHGEMSLVHHYIYKNKLRTRVVPALIRNGDVEGHYNIYVSWARRSRHVAWRVRRPIEQEGVQVEESEDIETEVIDDEGPHVEVLADADVLIMPQTADSVNDALESGGSVTILRRWSKTKIKALIASGDIIKDRGEAAMEEMNTEKGSDARDKTKIQTDAAGVKTGPGGKIIQVYETWTKLTLDGERRLCRVLFGGLNAVLSCKRNPYWSDRCPLISAPVKSAQGAFKGISLVKPVAPVQYYANDVINEAADSSMYSMVPIVMTDPEKNPRVGTMVLSPAAVWETSPESTQFAKFPDIWRAGFEIIGNCKAQILQSLSVSAAAITGTGQMKSKPSQADIAREQQVDILTTADAVTVLEESILTPMVNFFLELDHQYRDEAMVIRQFGETGIRAKMEWLEPIAMGKRWFLRWFGVEQGRTQQQIQQEIAALNVITNIPPDKMPGYRVDIVPLITHLVEAVAGPRLAPLLFRDIKSELSLDPEFENTLLAQGIDLVVHPADEDPQHLQIHQQLLAMGDPTRNVAEHIRLHTMQMALKQQAQLMQAIATMAGGPQQGAQPKGQGQKQGPRPGAQPGAQRQQGPPGMAHRDQIGPQSMAPPQLRNVGGMR